MHSRKLLVLLACLSLAACDRGGSAMMSQVALQDKAAPNGQQFSYSNFWSISMPRASVAPRFERARAACLNDKNLNCKLLTSNFNSYNGTEYSSNQAYLEILLPHARVEEFKKNTLSVLPGEDADDVALNSNSTRAENVEGESSSAGRKAEQLAAYRDRLVALSKRPNLNIEDTIRLEAEISRVQGDLDAATKEKTDADSRIARESVSISLGERTRGPIASVWNRASDIFVRNVANVIEFLIGVIPWLPIIAAVIFAFGWSWQHFRRRKAA